MRHARNQKQQSSPRGGVATLEFVMSMPILLTMFALLMWLGFSVIGQSGVTVRARYKSWEEHFNDQAENPLVFPTAEGFYELEKDFAVGEATKKVNAAPLFSRMPDPESNMTTLAGTWDYRALPLDSAPHWKEHGIVLLNSYTGGIQSLIGQLNGSLTDFIIGAGSNLTSKLDEADNVVNGGGGGSGGGGSGGGAGGGSGGSGAPPTGGGIGQGAAEREEMTKAEREAKRRELNQKLTETEAELLTVNEALFDARVEYRRAQVGDVPGETPEERAKRLDRLEAKVDLLKVKQRRLEMQRSDIRADLRALND